jgi:hypothetical protein
VREREGGLPSASGCGRGREQGGGGSNGELKLVHGRHVQDTRHPSRHFVGHVASNEVVSVERDLGQIWANLDLGPKSKVVAHEKLYDFHFGAMVIRVVD